MLGLTRGMVVLLPHNEEWHGLFEEEKERILTAAGDRMLAVEHIGSTSICGISAKPILDIMIGISEFDAKLPFQKAIEDLGYDYKGENGIPERHFFGKGVPRTVHLNAVRFGGNFWLSHVAFRDYLIQNPDAASEYEQLKQALAVRFANDRESYTNGKQAFVERIISLTGREQI